MPVPLQALTADSIVEYFNPSTKQRLLTLGVGFAADPVPTCAREAADAKKSIGIVRGHIVSG